MRVSIARRKGEETRDTGKTRASVGTLSGEARKKEEKATSILISGRSPRQRARLSEQDDLNLVFLTNEY